MTVGEAVRRRILALCEERSITINRLSILSGVTQSTLNNIMSGRNHTTTVATVKKLCDGLNITVDEFFCPEYFHDLEQELKKHDRHCGRFLLCGERSNAALAGIIETASSEAGTVLTGSATGRIIQKGGAAPLPFGR